ncbi:MAG: FAD-dependent oxidoreductase, partial [Ignavibacteriae bacterium]|nr:FAD-dependent oxidoreductase [Ignavibacteriota bacterium]
HPLILASFNTFPDKVSADLFVKLVKKGTEFKKNMSIILSDANLNDLFINSAIDYLNSNSVKMNLYSTVKKINIKNNSIQNIEMEDGKTAKADYYLSTVPFYAFPKLFEYDKYLQYFYNIEKLKSSTIISVHLFFKEDLNIDIQNDMTGLVDTVVQWIFIKNKKHLCLVISGADFIENNLTEKDNDEIISICLNDLKSCLNGFDERNVLDYKVIKEKRATFIPEVGSEHSRIKQDCNIDNLYIGGDWTDTGYPATIEGAIKSAKICADLIINKKINV